MKTTVRSNTFETNSSSMHSIAIAKGDATPGGHITFFVDDFGWDPGYAMPSSYLYTAILQNQPEAGERLDKLKSYLDKHDISYSFIGDKGSIDQAYGLEEFLDVVLADEDMLTRFLFNPDSYVYTGNDNSNSEDPMTRSACPTIWIDGKQPNPDHHPDKFDYFFKSN